MRWLHLLVLLFLSNVGFSQKEANIWYFGNNAGLDFNSSSPVALSDGKMATQEGCASIADNNGVLQFYTDGTTVWNRNHNIMANGNDLKGNFSSTQSAIIVPKPNSSNIYFIFTVDYQGSPNGLQYSEVDMTLDSGMGAIISKNILLTTPVLEKLTAVQHANGNDIWVIAHKNGSAEFYSYLVTDTGVHNPPVITSIGFSYSGVSFSENAGYMKVSPDGSRLAMAFPKYNNAIQLFDFNNNTGVLSNHINMYDIPVASLPYGIEFSPSGKILYASGSGGVAQYDITLSTAFLIQSSTTFLSSTINDNIWRAMQLATDGKIYITRLAINGAPDINTLSVINNPDELGGGCDFQLDTISLGSGIAQAGLPPFIQSFFKVGFQSENVCEGNENQFNSNISQPYNTLVWDFGDGNTSTVDNPIHTYSDSGDYEVSLTVMSGTISSTDTKTITVYEVPTLTPVVELRQCDDDLDGFTVFNLTEANAKISSNNQNEIITYHKSKLEAENNNNSILNSTSYINQAVSLDTLWARVENDNGCYTVSQLNLRVSTTQIPNTFKREFYQCDDGLSSSDGISTFDFGSVNTEIKALFPAGQQLIINYYRNLSDALSETNFITDISAYQNTDYPNTQNIYIRVDSAVDNDCLGLGHHITLNVETVPVANTVSIPQQCDDDGDGMYSFDTTSIETTLLNGQSNVRTEYYDELGNVLSSPLPNPFLTSSQKVTARVVNSNSLDSNGFCYNETILSFLVENAAIAYPVSDFIACDDNNDGDFDFDVSTIESQILNGQKGMFVSYFDQGGVALPNPLPNPFTTDSRTITVRVGNSLSSSCFDETTINFIVSRQPKANNIADDFICDNASNTGEHTFNLNNYNSQILNGQDNPTFEVMYFVNEFNARSNIEPIPKFYTVNSTSEKIYARIQNRNNFDCYDIASFHLGVNYFPEAYKPKDFTVCDDDSNDGFETVDLTVQDAIILNGQAATDNRIRYYLNYQDAEEDINPQPTNFTNSINPQTLYARIENVNSPNCYSITSFELIVNQQPILLMNNLWPICEGSNVQIIADEGYDSYNWSTGETTRTITVDEPGQYTICASNVYGNLTCSAEKIITVSRSDIAIIKDIQTIDWSRNDNTISVFVEGNGDYEYSLDGIRFQDDSIFTRLNIEEYTVYVRDKNGCGIVSDNIYLIYYPRFFTPNGDGTNDTWQIINSSKEPNNKVYIYDRYGKLITQLKPNDLGWDGALNGSKLPSSDYWFILERQNGKTYNGHFSLKR